MENPHLRPNNINYFTKKIEHRINDILEDGSNVHHIFYANYINYLLFYHKNEIRLEENNKKNISSQLYKMLSNALLLLNDSNSEYSYISKFAEKEILKFSNETSIKGKIYYEFMLNNLKLFLSIDISIEKLYVKNYYYSFKNFAEQKINVKLIKIDEIDKTLNFLFRIINQFFVQSLIYFGFVIEKINEVPPFIIPKVKKIINPSLLLDESEIIQYRVILLKWVNYAHEELKEKFLKEFDHPLLQFIKEEIQKNILKPENEELKNDDVKIIVKKNEKEVELSFPEHIFFNHNAFLLFHTLASQTTSIPDISFWYRQMNEVEKPKLIKVLLNEFIPWFNRQNYPLENVKNLKTLDQSNGCERETYYRIIKDLIYSK